MATVKILYDKDTSSLEEYLKVKRDVEGPTTENGCTLEGVTKQFAGLHKIHGTKGYNSIHIIQSWSPAESSRLSREQVHSMGLALVEKFAPGHQYVIQTHTEEAHAHNHIVLNPVSIETGKRICNKKRHLGTLRDLNDQIARENGLSVLPRQDVHPRRGGLSDKVKRIDNYRGKSHIADLANKANFARHFATNYDEYVALLNSLDVQVRIEPENITYFYPGRKHGKRGRNFSPALDKAGLEKKFQANLEKYDKSSDQKRTLAELTALYRDTGKVTASSTIVAPDLPPLVSERSEAVTKPRPEAIERSLIPIEEIQRAKTQSVIRYCGKHKIQLSADDKGRTVLSGREYVEVSDYSWINHRNKTRGNLIDFVANHEEISFLQAVARINDNPKLLLLERYLGEPKRQYQSFYVPRENPASRGEALVHLSRLIGYPPAHPVYAELFRQQKVHVTRGGAVLFFSAKSQDGYVEYVPMQGKEYSRIKKGHPQTAFWEPSRTASELELFLDPRSLLKHRAHAIVQENTKGVAALFEPDLEAAHQLLARQSKLRRLVVIPAESDRGSQAILAFFEELKRSLDPFSIDTELAWEPVRESEQDRARAGLSLDLGLERELPGW